MTLRSGTVIFFQMCNSFELLFNSVEMSVKTNSGSLYRSDADHNPVFESRNRLTHITGWPYTTRITGLPGREGRLKISIAVLMQYTSVTGGLTDGHLPIDSSRLRMASRSNNMHSVIETIHTVPAQYRTVVYM